jgi:hypothetical protein
MFMQMQIRHDHKLMPYTYSCGLCGEVFVSSEPPDPSGDVCESCKEWQEKDASICPLCGESCGIEDEMCKECESRAVCYSEMPAPKENV